MPTVAETWVDVFVGSIHPDAVQLPVITTSRTIILRCVIGLAGKLAHASGTHPERLCAPGSFSSRLFNCAQLCQNIYTVSLMKKMRRLIRNGWALLQWIWQVNQTSLPMWFVMICWALLCSMRVVLQLHDGFSHAWLNIGHSRQSVKCHYTQFQLFQEFDHMLSKFGTYKLNWRSHNQ